MCPVASRTLSYWYSDMWSPSSFEFKAHFVLCLLYIFSTVTGGMTREEGLHVCQEVARTGLLAGMDIVEVNPQLGTKLDVLKTSLLAFDMVGASLGLSIQEIHEAEEEFMAVVPPLTSKYQPTRIPRLPYYREPIAEPISERRRRHQSRQYQ